MIGGASPDSVMASWRCVFADESSSKGRRAFRYVRQVIGCSRIHVVDTRRLWTTRAAPSNKKAISNKTRSLTQRLFGNLWRLLG
eukprot:scaffold260267_cov14-Prasinocladus_malaysianus.AAC.1